MLPKSRIVKRHYGWVPDLPDHRDYAYSAPPVVVGALPPRVDLRRHCPPVYDQGQLGSCTANAIAAAIEFAQRKERKRSVLASRLFIYWNEREIEHTVRTDSGAQLRDGMKVVAKIGAPPENPDWPYVISRFALHPPRKAFADARKDIVQSYHRISHDLHAMKGCLAAGDPFVFGFTVYEAFESERVAKTGILPMPRKGERALGGHAVLAVGYDDAKRRFLVRNSWGARWGKGGYFEMPYEYVADAGLADDRWTIRG